ncbi:MAG: class I SAM-dependent methyltransferase [Variibacter sp.]
MSGFSASWLALRQPYDLRARNADVLAAASAVMRRHDALRITDLACGAGSTILALSRRASVPQAWRLVDNDPALLAVAAQLPTPAHITIAPQLKDLRHDLDALFEEQIDLLTTSALLDLVSEMWLEKLLQAVADHSTAFYAALSYNGLIDFRPHDPLDAAVIAAVNAHQRTDKGFGAALGPKAADVAIKRLDALGFRVVHGPSDWVLGPNDRVMQTELLQGWANAAREMASIENAELEMWLTRRHAAIAEGASSIRVGHVDFFAEPTGIRKPDKSQSNRSSSSI